MILRQSTAVDVLIGPFVDLTNGYTSETGESPAVKLSKNGQALAAKTDDTTPVHDADGYYNCELDATDTNTVGTLVLTVAATASALPVRHEFQVVETAIYDALFADAATGLLPANVTQVNGVAQTATLDTIKAETALIVADTNELQTDDYPTSIAAVKSDTAAILTDTGTTLDTLIKDIPTVAEFEARTLVSAGYASPTNITAGTITTVTNLTNAPANGDLTATMKTSVQTACDAAVTANTDINSIDTGISSIATVVIANAAGTDIAADIIALKAETATILADTAELQTNQGNWLTATGFSTHSAADVKTAIEASGSYLKFVKDVAEGDWSIDKSGSPWEIVCKIKSTATELIRKELKDVDGTAIAATTTVICQQVEPA